jgi:hypothetical protein
VTDHTPEAIEAYPDSSGRIDTKDLLRTAYTRGQRDTQARRYTTTVEAVAQTLADTDARTDGQATYRDMAAALLVPGGPLEDTNTEWEYGTKYSDHFDPMPHTFEVAVKHAETVNGHVVRRIAKIPAGPWVPAPTTETGEQK